MERKSLLAIVGVALILSAAFAIGSWFSQDGNRQADSTASKPSGNKASQPEKLPEGWAKVGGVSRPATDVTLDADHPKDMKDLKPQKKAHGFQPGLAVDHNEQVAGVYEALKDRSKPSRFSSFATPEPFDRAAYEANPEAYLNTIEPSRVFAPAQPGEGVKVLRSKSSRYHRTVQGESVNLVIETEPNMPVTFTSFDLGTFSNSLSSITVQANDQGIATAAFTAGPGTIGDVELLAASPVATSQVEFVVHVSLPAVASK